MDPQDTPPSAATATQRDEASPPSIRADRLRAGHRAARRSSPPWSASRWWGRPSSGWPSPGRGRNPPAPPAAEHPEWTVARRWNEALLDAIRRALPNPPVHARNLFHTSVAMWDAWAAYDPTATGYIVTEKLTASNVAAARDEAISYAAYRVLHARASSRPSAAPTR